MQDDALMAIFGNVRLCSRLLDRGDGRQRHCRGGFRGRGRLLALLREHDGISQRELADRLGIRAPSASELIERLAADGLVEKRLNVADRRVWQVFLTEKGMRLADVVGRNRREEADALLAAFSPEERAQLAALLYREALKKAKTVFFENEGNALIFQLKRITPKKQQTLLPGAGVNLSYYQQEPYPDHDRIHFLYMGRIMKEKGIDELFSAVQRLHREQGSGFVLDLVGFFEDEYKQRVSQLEADGIAVFHGFQEDPRPWYALADCVVLPSYHEGMSNVLLEAAATGRPIITSDIPGCREAVQEGISGMLCRAKDEKSLYEAMNSFCRKTREEREAMGKAGRAWMEERFDKTFVVEKTKQAILK